VQNWIIDTVRSLGELGVALLMLLENVFPPIPSELIMPLAGFLASKDEMSIAGAIVAGTLGSVAGTALWYWLGAKLGKDRLMAWSERHGKWLAMCPDDVRRGEAFFERHGRSSVFFGRFVPVVRTIISVPAGISGMPLGQFLLYTTAGSAIWVSVLVGAGVWLGSQFPKVGDYLGPLSWAVIAGAFIAYVWRLVRIRRGNSSCEPA
jgi:membrane protein DedA with SNARE-associated domain